MRSRFVGILLLATLFLYGSALPANAQLDSYVSQTAVSLSLSPQHPGSNQAVTITANSSLFELEASDMIWYVNGAVVAEGPAITSQTISAGGAGSETSVRVIVNQPGIGSASADATIRPADMDLLWESDSYVPPFYKGRAVPSEGASVRLQAMPHFTDTAGAAIPSSDIIFTWKKDNVVAQNASGRGRSSVVLPGPELFGNTTFSVDAKTTDGLLSASASVQIASVEPLVTLYKNDPLSGVAYNNALPPQASLPETEVTLDAVPYFAPVQSPLALQYAWKVNGQPISNGTRPYELTVNAQGSSGAALLELALSHATNFFLSVSETWNLMLAGTGGGSSGSGANPFNGPTQ